MGERRRFGYRHAIYSRGGRPSTAAAVNGNPQYADFGHGTMVAGLIHLIAPKAKILPLKAFRADGTGYTSDILRAIYSAMLQHANVLNMSFTLAAYSQEVATALSLATLTGTVSVAAAGNSGQNQLAYPAGLWNVLGIGSTTNDDQLSSFSNYGPQLVWIGAPGEGSHHVSVLHICGCVETSFSVLLFREWQHFC